MKKVYQNLILCVYVIDEDVVRTSVPGMFDKNPFDPSDFEDGTL